MRNTFIKITAGATLAAALAVPAFGLAGHAFADAESNGHNCVGVRLSSHNPPGAGPAIKEIAHDGPGAVAEFIHDTQDACED